MCCRKKPLLLQQHHFEGRTSTNPNKENRSPDEEFVTQARPVSLMTSPQDGMAYHTSLGEDPSLDSSSHANTPMTTAVSEPQRDVVFDKEGIPIERTVVYKVCST